MSSSEGFYLHRQGKITSDGHAVDSQHAHLDPDMIPIVHSRYIAVPLRDMDSLDTEHVARIMSICSMFSYRVMVAGSSCSRMIDKNLKYSDIDIYFRTPDDAKNVMQQVISGITGGSVAYEGAHLTDTDEGPIPLNLQPAEYIGNYSTICVHMPALAVKLQMVMLCGFNDPIHVINTFDFSVCKVATDGNNLYAHAAGILDIFNRVLRIDPSVPMSPSVIAKRIVKYSNKGFAVDRVFSDQLDSACAEWAKNYAETMYSSYGGR